MGGWLDDHIVETLGKGLRASLRIGWAGSMLVSPEPKDVAIQKHTHQAWSTRWSGEFSGASRVEAQKVRNVNIKKFLDCVYFNSNFLLECSRKNI